MAQFRTSRTFDVIFLIAMAACLWWAAANRIQIGDWLFFLHYQPDSSVTTVASDAGLNDLGRKLLYRTNPQLTDRTTMTQVCGSDDIGCITPRGEVYVLDESGQHDRSVVTSAHEMLHMAYRRLSSEQKDNLKPLIDQAIAMNAGTNLESELSGDNDSDDRYDEAHSLLGSEYPRLPPDLENYYQRYFNNRSKVVTAQSRAEAIDN